MDATCIMATTQPEANHGGFQAFQFTDKSSKQRFISSLLRMEEAKLKLHRESEDYDTFDDCLRCPNCRGVLVEPFTLTCGHTICRFCLSDEHFGSACCFCEGIEVNEISAPTFLLCNVTYKRFPKQVELSRIKTTAQRLLHNNDFQGALKQLTSEELMKGGYELDCNYYCLRSDCYVGLGNLNLALGDIESASSLSPYAIHMLKRKAHIFGKIGNYEKAVSTYVRLSTLQPEDVKLKVEIHSSLNGLLHVDFRDFQEAVSPRQNNAEKNVVVDRNSIMDEISSSTVQEKSVLLKETQQTSGITRETTQTKEGKEESRRLYRDSFGDRSFFEEFDCKLCCSLLLKPVTSPCGHTFCDECLRRSLDFRVDCPCCRTPLTKYLAERRTNVSSVIEHIIKILFPQEYQARKKAFESELESMKSVNNCSEFETPIFVCTLGLPSVPCPLHIFEPRYKLMIRRCVESGSCHFGMCTQSPDENHPFAMTGTMLKIKDVAYLPDGRSLINTEGARRFEVLSHSIKDGYNVAKVRFLVDEKVESDEEKSEILKLHVNGYKLLKFWFDKLSTDQRDCVVNAIGDLPNLEELNWQRNDEPKWLWWALAALPLMDKPKLIILSMTSILERLRSIWRFIVMMVRMQERNAASKDV